MRASARLGRLRRLLGQADTSNLMCVYVVTVSIWVSVAYDGISAMVAMGGGRQLKKEEKDDTRGRKRKIPYSAYISWV